MGRCRSHLWRSRAPHLHLLATTVNCLPQIKQVTISPWVQQRLSRSQLLLAERQERFSLRLNERDQTALSWIIASGQPFRDGIASGWFIQARRFDDNRIL